MKQYGVKQLVNLFYILLFAACASATPVSTETPTPAPTSTPALITAAPEQTGCAIIDVAPTPAIALSAAFPVLTESDFSRGNEGAAATIIAYCDLQTPKCQETIDSANRILINRPNDARFVFRPVPVMENPQFPLSEISIRALLAAQEQEKFWEMFDLLHLKYNEWANLNPPSAFEGWVVKEAVGLGLDGSKFKAGLKAEETEAGARSYFEAAKGVGVKTVPLILVNGIPQDNYATWYPSLDATVGMIALGRKQFKECPPFVIDPTRQYTATLTTKDGEIVIELYADKAPLAVNSFVFLARKGWYDGAPFHRVFPGFMAQTGDPSGTGMGGPGYFFDNEITDLKFDKPGVVAMANSGPDTNGSQFFVTYAPAEHLNGAYTIFGRVLKGMDAAEKIAPRDPQGVNPSAPDILIRVAIEEK